MQGDVFGNSLSYMGNGVELLRQLAKEFSLRSRAEAMSLRAMLMARTFQAQTSPAPVADTVRHIEVAVARFVRLLSTLDQRDAVGLAFTDSDQLTLLIGRCQSLRKAYTLHHSQGETYASTGCQPCVGSTNKGCFWSCKEPRACLACMRMILSCCDS